MNKTISKFLCFILVVVSLFFIAACNDKKNDGDANLPYNPDHGIDTNGELHYIIKDSSSVYKIVLPNEFSPCEEFSATELQAFIREATGVQLPIIKESQNSSDKIISIGNTELFKSLNIELDKEEYNLDGFRIKNVGDKIFICGARDKGTLYGVYDFLEKFAGVRFFYADKIKVPKATDLSVYDMDIKEIPEIRTRSFYTSMVDKDELYTTRLRMVSLYGTAVEAYGGSMYDDMYVYAHNTTVYVPPEKFLTTHPEWFYDNGSGTVYDICMSLGVNLDGTVDKACDESPFSVMVEALKATIKERPQVKYFSICQTDIPFGCPCEICRERDKLEYGGRSGILIRFVNAVSTELEKWMEEEYPQGREIKLVTFAYSYTNTPPIRQNGEWAVVPKDNICIWFASGHNLAYSLSDSRQPQQHIEAIEQWKEKAKSIFYWDYRVNYREYYLYMPGLTTLQEDIKYLVKINTEYAFLEAASGDTGDPVNWLMNLHAYIASKLMWNSNYDVVSLINEYLEFVYGDSESIVRNVINLFEDNYERLRQDEKTSLEFGIDHELGYQTLRTKWYPRNMLITACELLEKEVERVETSSMPAAEKAERMNDLRLVLLTPQRMLLMNYGNYFANDSVGERLLAVKFIDNCEYTGNVAAVGGYGNSLSLIKEKYGL